jgi:hypothetical protein
LAQDARAARTTVSPEDWRRFADSYGDLADPAAMHTAWE